MSKRTINTLLIIPVIVMFIIMTITGLKECPKQEEPFVLVDDIIFEVFMGENYVE